MDIWTTIRRGGLWLACIMLGMGCPKATKLEDEDLLSRIEAVDRAWKLRGEQRGLSRAWEVLESVEAPWASHPELRWRRARHLVSLGLASSSQVAARRAYADARAEAMGCLEDDRRVASAVRAGGWPGAIAAVSTDVRLRCGLWAGVSWTRWLTVFGGAAGAVDFEVVDALLLHAARLPDEEARDLLRRTQGVLFALKPRHLGQDVRAARELLTRAYEEGAAAGANDVWVRWEDLVSWTDLRDTPQPATQPSTPEERAARLRAGVREGIEPSR